MSGSFWARYDATRVSSSGPQPELVGAPTDDDEGPANTDRTFEVADERDWDAIEPAPPAGWRAIEWPDRPVRFIDGKDVGETVACLTAPFGGYPVPVRLSEIGAIVVHERDGELRREQATVERIVTLATDLFPWDEIEDLAIALRRSGFRLLSAPKPVTNVNGRAVAEWSHDFEKMRKAAQNASNGEMGRLEEATLALDNTLPTVVDGRLEPRDGGLQPRDPALGSWEVPAIGVVKTHWQNYLHAGGLRLLYRLKPGQRTPAFVIDPGRVRRELKVVSWYVKLAQQPTLAPNEGLIRVELPLPWFTRTFDGPTTAGWAFVDRLTLLLRDYRCRDATYGRAPVSLQPIVRAEQLLGALFTQHDKLATQFRRSQGL
jgi:hypothetical protein